MLNYQIVDAQREHVAHLAAHMREADRREVWASGRHTPYEALAVSLEGSARVWTAVLDGRPAAMWGVGRAGCLLSDLGRPWLLATDVIEKAGRLEFLRRSREFVGLMRAEFPRLENYVHARNTLSIKWLRWCGFVLDKAPVSINGEDFFRFAWLERRAKCAN